MSILVINTGGTFNKRYNSIKGELEVPKDTVSVEKILNCFVNLDYELKSIIHKDSLDMQKSDREELVTLIKNSTCNKIIIIHGTDTKNETALFLEEQIKNKTIILTGSMIPFTINKVEPTANLSMAIGYLLGEPKEGIYIAMHGLVESHEKVYKNREIGIFEIRD